MKRKKKRPAKKSVAVDTSNPPFALPDWPAYNTERRQVSGLKKNPRNARTHSQQQITMVAASINKFGWTMPILVDEDDVLIAGHARLDAADVLGITEVPVIVANGWSETQKRAYIEADNRLNEIGGWDLERRRAELEELRDSGFEMAAIGWALPDLEDFLGRNEKEGLADPDDAGAAPERPIVRTGDLWEMGDHRIICGDAADQKVWDQLFRKSPQAAMVFTDPPYGVSYEARSGEFAVIEGDHKRSDELYGMLVNAFKRLTKVTADDAAFYIWHASTTRTDFTDAMRAAGLVERQYLIWAKPTIGLGYSDYRWAHEPCFYASKAEHSPVFYGEPNESTVWRVAVTTGKEVATVIGPGVVINDGAGRSLYVTARPPKTKKPREVRLTKERQTVVLHDEGGAGTVWEVSRDRDYEHPTQKPVELAKRAIMNSSQRGEIVLDCFLGSGTTLIGAEITGRTCYGIDIDPVYAEVSIKRWMKFSGKRATLNGRDFSDIERERQNETGHPRESVPGGKRSARPDRALAE